MTYGEKYTEKDVKSFYSLVGAKNGKISAKYCQDMLTGRLKEEEAEDA